jgi:hypothetical protein
MHAASRQEEMMSTSTKAAPLLIPPEVTAFAAENGAAEYLPKFVELAEQVFAGQPITLRLVDDPELSYNRRIFFDVTVSGWDDDHYSQAKNRWYSESARLCPPKYFYIFGLCIL